MKPVLHGRVAASKGSAFAFSETAPNPEVRLPLEGFSQTFQPDGAAQAALPRLPLGSTSNEQGIWRIVRAQRTRNPALIDADSSVLHLDLRAQLHLAVKMDSKGHSYSTYPL